MFELFEVPPHGRKTPAPPPAAPSDERTPQEMAALVRQIADEVVEGILLELYGLDALPLLEQSLPPWAVWSLEDADWDDASDADDDWSL